MFKSGQHSLHDRGGQELEFAIMVLYGRLHRVSISPSFNEQLLDTKLIFVAFFYLQFGFDEKILVQNVGETDYLCLFQQHFSSIFLYESVF